MTLDSLNLDGIGPRGRSAPTTTTTGAIPRDVDAGESSAEYRMDTTPSTKPWQTLPDHTQRLWAVCSTPI